MFGKGRMAGFGAVVVAGLIGAGAAVAQQLDPGISCIEGNVESMDYSELESKYKESIWDSKAAVRLRSNNDELDLRVSDIYGNTVCEETADSRTRCKFNFPASYAGIFNIRIDNRMATSATYRLCAE